MRVRVELERLHYQKITVNFQHRCKIACNYALVLKNICKIITDGFLTRDICDNFQIYMAD